MFGRFITVATMRLPEKSAAVSDCPGRFERLGEDLIVGRGVTGDRRGEQPD
jgi:hypothetical protein